MGLGFQSFSLDSPRGDGGSICGVRLFRFSFVPSSRGDVHAVDQEMDNPVSYDQYDICSMVKDNTLGKLNLGVLKNLKT